MGSRVEYRALRDEEKHSGDEEPLVNQRRNKYPTIVVSVLAIFIGLVVFNAIAGLWRTSGAPKLWAQTGRCRSPIVRREWRSLTPMERHEYIQAVNNLRNIDSSLGLQSSRYFDFAMAHSRMGEQAHESAPFLPWHRLFLRRFEQALAEQSEYNGGLVYWDWSLDSTDLRQAPVWDTNTGFGGSGNRSDSPSIDNGWCVTDGPFARMEVPFVFINDQSHCLSRGFPNDTEHQRYGDMVAPKSVKTVLQTPDYKTFNLGLEHRAHAAIPSMVQGDFTHFTAPADPVFFLHHTQLDRIWWLWQQRDLPQRYSDYAGPAAYQSDKDATLDDMLRMGGLGDDKPVHELMNTESDLLCYKY